MQMSRYTQTVLKQRSTPRLDNPNAIQQAVAPFEAAANISGVVADYAFREKAALDTVKLNDTVLSYQKDIIDASDKLRQQHAGNPEGFADMFETESAKIQDVYLKQLGGGKLKQQFRTTAKELNLRNYERNLSWQRERSVSMMAETLENSAQTNEALAYRYGQDGGSLEELLNNADASTVAAATLMDPEKVADVNETMRRGTVNNYLQGLLASGRTGDAKKILDSKKYDSLLGGDGLASGYGAIETTQKSLEAAQKKALLASREADIASQLQNETNLSDLLSGDDLSYEEKIAEVNRLDFNGLVRDDFAVEARRYLGSEKEINAVTNSDEMAGIVTRMYDLNEIADISPNDYLDGISQIKKEIMAKRSSGDLSRDDEKKLNGQMKTLMSAKTSEATKAVSLSFGEARKMIEQQIPAGYRGEAIRKLFYLTAEPRAEAGKDKDQRQELKNLYKVKAKQVIDEINLDLRNKAIKKLEDVKKPQDDTESFLKEKGYTMDDVKETAAKYGMSEAQVINTLRSK